MITLGIYEAKTKLSEICERVAQTGEPVVVTRRGVPLVRIDPVGPQDGVGSTIWELRNRFVEEHGDLASCRSLGKLSGPEIVVFGAVVGSLRDPEISYDLRFRYRFRVDRGQQAAEQGVVGIGHPAGMNVGG